MSILSRNRLLHKNTTKWVFENGERDCTFVVTHKKNKLHVCYSPQLFAGLAILRNADLPNPPIDNELTFFSSTQVAVVLFEGFVAADICRRFPEENLLL